MLGVGMGERGGGTVKTKTNHKTIKEFWFQLILSRDLDDQRILQSDWMRDTLGKRIASLRYYLPLMTISMQIEYWEYQFIFSRDMSPAVWLDERQNWPHPTKSGSFSFRELRSLDDYSMKNSCSQLFLEMLMIKEFCNLTGREAQQATSDIKL